MVSSYCRRVVSASSLPMCNFANLYQSSLSPNGRKEPRRQCIPLLRGCPQPQVYQTDKLAIFQDISATKPNTHTPDYTDISIAIVLCGLYPLITKSSAFHPSMLPPAGRAISSVGNARGSRSSCVRSASTWLR